MISNFHCTELYYFHSHQVALSNIQLPLHFLSFYVCTILVE